MEFVNINIIALYDVRISRYMFYALCEWIFKKIFMPVGAFNLLQCSFQYRGEQVLMKSSATQLRSRAVAMHFQAGAAAKGGGEDKSCWDQSKHHEYLFYRARSHPIAEDTAKLLL
ncbi:MAG: hypothetical protein ACI9OO_001770 [Bacteroidia bacterium]|jgi:hypothetical protein